MKKILMFIFCFCLLTGCVKKSATDVVKDYLEKFRNYDEEVVVSLRQLIQDENLYENQQKLYELILKKQYVHLNYKIVSETYDGEEADIQVQLEVYDYLRSRKKAIEYRRNLPEEFLDENQHFSKEKYQNLQLRYMSEETNRVKYTVTFHASLQDDQWNLTSPDYTILQKIQGVYDYLED